MCQVVNEIVENNLKQRSRLIEGLRAFSNLQPNLQHQGICGIALLISHMDYMDEILVLLQHVNVLARKDGSC